MNDSQWLSLVVAVVYVVFCAAIMCDSYRHRKVLRKYLADNLLLYERLKELFQREQHNREEFMQRMRESDKEDWQR